MKQITLGLVLLVVGVLLGQNHSRPFIDWDFLLSWYGLILLLDKICQKFGFVSVFSPAPEFLKLAFASSVFWWLYEGANIFLKNWKYPIQPLYSATEWGLLATLAFTTVLPVTIVCTRLVSIIIPDYKAGIEKFKLNHLLGLSLSGIGVACLVFSLLLPTYFFPLIWPAFFLIIDPINACQGRRSLIVAVFEKRWRIILSVSVGVLLAGLLWETINFLIPKWVYTFPNWFWSLPAFLTVKIFQMPLVGYLGYIPFGWSAFSFTKLTESKTSWVLKRL